METRTYKVKVTFLTPVLGSQSTRDVATQYIAKKNNFELPEDEVESLPEALEQGTTVFHRDAQGRIILFDYQVKGMLKNAGKVLNGMVSGNVKNLRSKVANLVFVQPRQIVLQMPDGAGMVDVLDVIERPLRAQTAQGERVALARSEVLPEGTWFECGLEVYPGQITPKVLEDLLDYGYNCGLGQWRGGGYGRFLYELVEEE